VKRAALLLAASLLCGCAGRGLLPEAESREAAAFFAREASALAFPASSTFSGVFEQGGDALPFVAGVRAESASDEAVGLFDPLGHEALTLRNDGAAIRFEAGPVAGPLAALDGKRAPSGGLSLARLLGGAPGYPVAGGESRRGADGGWEFSDGRQTLRTDPGRRFLSGAEYEVAGRTLRVEYPGREAGALPPLVRVGVRGATIELRRDTE
jgi:hypothetical protein